MGVGMQHTNAADVEDAASKGELVPGPPGSVTRLTTISTVQSFVADVLLSHERRQPVVALTTWHGDRVFPIDPDSLAGALGSAALVVTIPTGDLTWALSKAIPKRLDVYGGAARIWWPGLSAASDPYDNPLLFMTSRAHADLVRARIVAAVLGTDRPVTRQGGPVPEGGAGDTSPKMTLDPWRLISEVYHVGDVVRGRISRLASDHVLVEILPGAVVYVPRHEVDYVEPDHPHRVFAQGEPVNVKIFKLDAERRKAAGSIKRAYNVKPTAVISPGLGQHLSLADDPSLGPMGDSAAQVVQLAAELAAARAALDDLRIQLRAARKQVAELRRENRSADRRHQAWLAEQIDPTSSDTAFLVAVRVAYARNFEEDDRQRYPLERMRVGRTFLDSLLKLSGVSVTKVVEVCAQVAAQRAHLVAGREVHQLSGAGAPARIRSRDRAKAWRCSLQDNTASARRLHWWDIPGSEGRGRVIEFASVGVHDDVNIPE